MLQVNEIQENGKTMFISQSDLKQSIYDYQLNDITEGDEAITLNALEAAEDEIRGYLTGNNKKDWNDGRIKYDVDAILSALGTERNQLILAHAVVIAKWWIVDLCNADMIYEQAKERYDRSRDWLKDLANGTVTLGSLPVLDETSTEGEEEQQDWFYGSRAKFNHEY